MLLANNAAELTWAFDVTIKHRCDNSYNLIAEQPDAQLPIGDE